MPVRAAHLASRLSVPVLRGPLRGARWLPASGGKLARVLLGTYEVEQMARFVALARPGQVVFDIGASVGFYTLLAARCVGPSGRVVACEPDPANLRYLEAHVKRNGLAHVQILPCALSDRSGRARFASASGSGRGHLDENGALEVEVCRLDDVAAERALPPHHLKIDVEGAELEVLLGAEQTLRAHRPTIFLSTHDRRRPGVEHACRELLAGHGYRCVALAPGELHCTPSERDR
jgi:FkbM family methyltransferase